MLSNQFKHKTIAGALAPLSYFCLASSRFSSERLSHYPAP